ncbi:hypothetical protein Trydic_g4771 [Trypoxylus dichotomus]
MIQSSNMFLYLDQNEYRNVYWKFSNVEYEIKSLIHGNTPNKPKYLHLTPSKSKALTPKKRTIITSVLSLYDNESNYHQFASLADVLPVDHAYYKFDPCKLVPFQVGECQ